jgi:hypothetical protein
MNMFILDEVETRELMADRVCSRSRRLCFGCNIIDLLGE